MQLSVCRETAVCPFPQDCDEYYDKRRRKWVASITYQHKRLNLGRFKDKDDAIAIRLKTEAELFREFAPQSHIMDERMECVR